MRATRQSLLVLVAVVGPAYADDDARPKTISIPLPPGDFTPQALPADVPPDAPADGWWKKKGACPKGTRLDHYKPRGRGDWTGYSCKGRGSPKPYTAWKENDREAWWTDADDQRHGGLHRKSFAYEDSELYIHGKQVGRGSHRALGGNQDAFANYRDGKLHGLAHDALPNRTAGGYYIDGKREGVWFVWNTPGDIIRARLLYKDGRLDGTQRWWTRDGTLLAKGTFVAGDGTWTAFGADGTRTETRCKGRELVDTTARDKAGTIVMRACPTETGAISTTPTASGCKPVGTHGGGERQKLGEIACGDPTVPPFILW
jgi:hypothetical protein